MTIRARGRCAAERLSRTRSWLWIKNAARARHCSGAQEATSSAEPHRTYRRSSSPQKRDKPRLVSLQVASRHKEMSQPALFPGYKHVEAFGADDEYESKDGVVEEEVEYVTLDLGSVEPTLVPSSSSYRLIVSPRVVYPHSMCSHAFDASMQGLDTPTPFLQLSGTMLKGQHVSLLGTELLFAEGASYRPAMSGPR